MKKETFYLDTSIISAYSDTREPEKMEQTRDFLNKAKNNEMFISMLVIEEIKGIKNTNRTKVTKDLLKNFYLLEYSEEIAELAEIYLREEIIPINYDEDALHIAYAVVNDIDILVSWNFIHIVKRNTRLKVNAVNELRDYRKIEIIAPIEY
ncbi:MAG: PIN domain-containing protein [Candidatus Scalindua sp.]